MPTDIILAVFLLAIALIAAWAYAMFIIPKDLAQLVMNSYLLLIRIHGESLFLVFRILQFIKANYEFLWLLIRCAACSDLRE